jgi:hypothetical protein
MHSDAIAMQDRSPFGLAGLWEKQSVHWLADRGKHPC